MKTANGIYYNLKESEYRFRVGEMTFYFSSKLYLNKFMNNYIEEKQRFNKALQKVYKNKFSITFDMLAWVRLYSLIEKRGFYITFEGVEVTCPEDLAFVGIVSCKNKLEN